MLGCDQQQNLGQRGRASAITRGVLFGGLALGWALLASELGLTRQLGWLVALPAIGCAYSLISGTFGICLYHSIRGARFADHGREAVLDPETRAHIRVRAALAVAASLLIALGFALALSAAS